MSLTLSVPRQAKVSLNILEAAVVKVDDVENNWKVSIDVKEEVPEPVTPSPKGGSYHASTFSIYMKENSNVSQTTSPRAHAGHFELVESKITPLFNSHYETKPKGVFVAKCGHRPPLRRHPRSSTVVDNIQSEIERMKTPELDELKPMKRSSWWRTPFKRRNDKDEVVCNRHAMWPDAPSTIIMHF